MKAEIIAVGAELLMGETQDTNSSWIGSRLPEMGLDLQWVTIVGDDVGMLTDIIGRAWGRSDVILTIGGLGPTKDDVTRDGVASVLGEEMTVDPGLAEWLESSFARRNIRPMPQQNLRQASIIPSANAIHNSLGTAPSWWIERDNRIIATLPGPPRELMNMWTTEIAPRLRERVPGDVIRSRTFKTIGLSEAAVDELVAGAYEIPGMDLGVYAKPDGIYVRAIARAANEEEAQRTLAVAEELIRTALGDYIWGTDEEFPPELAGGALLRGGHKLAVMESCTGGMLGAAITDIPGSSAYFVGGAITYTDDLKIKAGVPPETVRAHGAVSEETAIAMASAACAAYGADCGIGVTGVAGPDDVDGVKAGTVYIAVAHPGGVDVQLHQFPSRRPLVRARAVTAALLQLLRVLREG